MRLRNSKFIIPRTSLTRSGAVKIRTCHAVVLRRIAGIRTLS